MTASILRSASNWFTRAASFRSPTTSRAAGTARRCPNERLSRTTTSCPRANSARTVWLPIYPAPPVTRMFIVLAAACGFAMSASRPNRETASGERSIRTALRDAHEHVVDIVLFFLEALQLDLLGDEALGDETAVGVAVLER